MVTTSKTYQKPTTKMRLEWWERQPVVSWWIKVDEFFFSLVAEKNGGVSIVGNFFSLKPTNHFIGWSLI